MSANTVVPLDIGVIGGGMIGQRIVQEALDRGHRVALIVRDPSRVTLEHERLKVVQGDVLDTSRIGRLAEKQDGIVSAVGVARAENPDYTLYLRAAESLAAAMREIGTAAPRLIVVGGVGSLKDPAGNLLIERVPEDHQGEHLGQKAALDFYRRITDLKWTYLSPPARIVPGERIGRYRRGMDDLLLDENGVSAISMEDFAMAIVDELESPQHVGERFTVAY